MAKLTGFTSQQINRWAESKGYTLNEEGLLKFSGTGGIVRLAVPSAPLEMLALIRGIFLTDVPGYEPSLFSGGGVALSQFDLWDETADAIGWRYYEGMLRIHGIDTTIAETPAVIVDGGRDSWLNVCTIALLPVVFRWDAWLLSIKDTFVAFVSHDGYIDVAFPTELAAVRMKSEMVADRVVVIPRISPNAGAKPFKRDN